MVLVLRQNQRVSRISAAAEKRIPVKIVREIRAMKRECRAGIGPRGTGRRRRRRNRCRIKERRMYVRIEVNRNDQVEPHDCVWLHLKFIILGCSDK